MPTVKEGTRDMIRSLGKKRASDSQSCIHILPISECGFNLGLSAETLSQRQEFIR